MNAAYLCARVGIPRVEWPSYVAGRIGVSEERSHALLCGDSPAADELERLGAALGVDKEELLGPIFEYRAEELLSRNLRFVLESSGCATDKELAARAGVEPASLSRWKSGAKTPSKESLTKLARAAGFADVGGWDRIAWFLVYAPLSLAQRKAWITRRVSEMDAPTFSALYPALERLLGER